MSLNVLVNRKADGDNKPTFPIDFGVGKLTKFGKPPVKLSLEVDYSVVRPEDYGQRWLVRLTVVPVPPALVKDPVSK